MAKHEREEGQVDGARGLTCVRVRGPRATSPRDTKRNPSMNFVFMEKHKTKEPPGGYPHSRSTRGAGAGKGAWPPTRTGEARAPRGAGRLRERRKEKGDYGELQLAVCKRKDEGAELRYSRPKPAAVNANSLSFTSPHTPAPARLVAPAASKSQAGPR